MPAGEIEIDESYFGGHRKNNGVLCDSVIIATPVDLTRFIKINKPSARVKYGLSEKGKNAIKLSLEKRGFV